MEFLGAAAPFSVRSMSETLYSAFQASARRHADRRAIFDAGRSLTYRQVEALSRRAGRAFLALGLERADPVSIWANNRWEWALAGLGLQAAGGVLVPHGTRLRAGEVAEVMRRTRSRLLFCDPGYGDYSFVDAIAGEHLPDLATIVAFDAEGGARRSRAGRIMSFEHFLGLADRVGEAALDARIAGASPEEVADIFFTSGTTGTPKGVPMTHAQSLAACAMQQADITHFVPEDVFAVAYPFGHNAGYRAGWQVTFLYGASIIPVRSYQPADIMRMIEAQRVTILPAAPPIWRAILDHPDRPIYDLSSLRIVSTGGTMVPVRLIEELQDSFGRRTVSTGYGLTEVAGSVTNTREDDDARTIATTTGRPLRGVSIKILDGERREVAQGQPGEIAIKAPQVLHGYFQDAAATRAAFTADGYFLTGDVGVFDDAGNLKITDRLKDMYIVGGFNCYPAEIERILLTLDGVASVAVIGVEDERLGQVGKAFIVRKPDARLDEAAVIAWSRDNMANYKAPRSVTFLDAMPLNAMGKIAKTELTKMG